MNNLFLILIIIFNIFGIITFVLIKSHAVTSNYTNYHKITEEHANNASEIAEGLMYRKEKLSLNHGMLFHTGYKLNSFWMKNTYIPLDVLFLDKDFKILGFVENTTPLSLDSISIDQKSHYVLEMNAGWIHNNNVKINDIIKI